MPRIGFSLREALIPAESPHLSPSKLIRGLVYFPMEGIFFFFGKPYPIQFLTVFFLLPVIFSSLTWVFVNCLSKAQL